MGDRVRQYDLSLKNREKKIGGGDDSKADEKANRLSDRKLYPSPQRWPRENRSAVKKALHKDQLTLE